MEKKNGNYCIKNTANATMTRRTATMIMAAALYAPSTQCKISVKVDDNGITPCYKSLSEQTRANLASHTCIVEVLFACPCNVPGIATMVIILMVGPNCKTLCFHASYGYYTHHHASATAAALGVTTSRVISTV